MKLRHSYVTLIDLSEILPFSCDGKIDASMKEAERNLFLFMSLLEKKAKQHFCYIGEDIISEKYYKRFLFEKGGFVEIMTGAPVVLCAHFTSELQAKKFAEALKNSLKSFIKNRNIGILLNTIEVHTEKEEQLTYEKWRRMHDIRMDLQ